MSNDSTEAIAQEPAVEETPTTDMQQQPNQPLDEESWFEQATNYPPSTEEEKQDTEESSDEPTAGDEPQEEVTSEEEIPGDEPETPQKTGETDEQYRRRVRTTDPMLAEVLKLQAADPDKPYEQLHREARESIARQIGVEIPDSQRDVQEAEPEEPDGRPQTMAELEAKLDQLMDEKVEAMEVEYDLKKAGKIEREMHLLEKYGKQLETRERQAQSREQSERAEAFQSSTDKAISYYPDAAKEGSNLHTEILRLDKIMRDTEDSRVSSADYPWTLVKLAAANKAVAPVDPNAKATPAAPTKEAAPKKPAAPIAPGNFRADAPQAKPPNLIDRVQNESDYWNMAESLRKGDVSLSNG